MLDHVRSDSQESDGEERPVEVEGESLKPARRRTRDRRIGARRGRRDGGACAEEKAIGMCARKGGRRSSTEGFGTRAIASGAAEVKWIDYSVNLVV